MSRRRSTQGSSLWRLSGRARDQRGHGGGSAGAGGRRSASSSHAPDGRTRCGDGARRLQQARASADVEPFLYDMGRQLGRADVVVCRAGATTLAEITAAGEAAILIPLPTATDDHQRKNAEALAANGRGGVAAAARPDRATCWRSGFCALAGDPTRRAADGGGGARAGAAGRRAGDRRSGVGAGGRSG